MDFCKCCGDDPKVENLDYLYKRSDCAVCGKEKRSNAMKTTGLAKAVLAIEARRKFKMSTKQSDSGPKCIIGHASRVPVNKAKAQMRPVKNCKRCGMLKKQSPGDEMILAQMMDGQFGKQITNVADNVVEPVVEPKKPQNDCTPDEEKKKALKKILIDRQLTKIKTPLLEPKISETTLVCNGFNTEDVESRQSFMLHPSTGAINKSHNLMKFSEHKSKCVPPLNKILSDLTLSHSACGEQRKPPQEEITNPGDIRFDTEHDPYDNDSMLVFPLKFIDDKYRYQFVEDLSDYYTPDSETSPTIETVCYSSSKLSKNSNSCRCVVQSKKLSGNYHCPKVAQPLYLHNLKLSNNQLDSKKSVQVVKDKKEEVAKFVTIPKSNKVNKPPKIVGMKTKTTNKNPTQKADHQNSQSIRKLPPKAMTRHDRNVKNNTQDEKSNKITCLRRNDKKIPPKIEDPKKISMNGILGSIETERTSLKTTQTKNSYGSLNMQKTCVPRTFHDSQNVLKKGGQVIKDKKKQDTKIVNITFQSNGKKISPPKIKDSKNKSNKGILRGIITERTGLKTAQTKNSYGSMKVHEACLAKTCRNSNNQNVLKKGGQVVKHNIHDKNIVNITFQSNVKKIPQQKVEASEKKCNNGVKTTKRSNLYGSSKVLEPCKARTHFDLSQKGNNILKKQGLNLKSKQTVNDKNKTLKYCVPSKGVKRLHLEAQPQTKELNKPTKENEVMNEALGYLRLHQATSGTNSIAGTECPKCEPPRRILAKSDIFRVGDINTLYIKKRGKLDLPVYEPRPNFNKSVSFSYKPQENEANTALKIPDKQENLLTNSHAQINLIKRKEFQALKAQQTLGSLETKINSTIKTQNNKIITQNNDSCELKTNINTTTSQTKIKSKQSSEKILKKSLWAKFATHASREKIVEKLNAMKPDIRQSVSNSKIQTITTKPSCSVNLKELSPRMRLLLGIHPQKLATTDNRKRKQQNVSHPTGGIVLEKKQSKIGKPNVEHLQEQVVDPYQRTTAGNTLNLITIDLDYQNEPCSAALELNSTGLDNHLSADQHQISIQNPGKFNINETSIEKTLPHILQNKTTKINFQSNSKNIKKIDAIERTIPEKYISKLNSNNGTKQTLFIETTQKNELGKEDPKIICLEDKKEIKTVKPIATKLKIIHNHTPKMYPDTMKTLVKNHRSNNNSPVAAKTSINPSAKTTQLHATPLQKQEKFKTKRNVEKRKGHSKIPKSNQINLSNPMESLLGNLQQFFIEIYKVEVEELEFQPKQCTILMVAIEIGFMRTGHFVQVAPSQQQLAKMETIVLSEYKNVIEDEVMDDKLLDDFYIKRRGMIWADPVKEAQPVGCKKLQNVIEINLEKVSKRKTELAKVVKKKGNQVKLSKAPHKVESNNLQVRYVGRTSLHKDNISKIPDSIPEVVTNIKRNSMIWADPVKEEQTLGYKMPRNLIEIYHKKDFQHKTELAKSSNEDENQIKLYKMPSKVKQRNLKIRFVDQTSIDKDNMSKKPGSRAEVANISEYKKNLDRDFQSNKDYLPSGSSGKLVGKLKAFPNQTHKKRKSIPLKSLSKQISGGKNSECNSNSSNEAFYSCRQGYLTSPRHCDFRKLPINKPTKSPTKIETGFNVSKKPTKPCIKNQSIYVGSLKSGDRQSKKFNNNPNTASNLNLSIDDKLEFSKYEIKKKPFIQIRKDLRKQTKGKVQKPMLKPNRSSSYSSQYDSTQKNNGTTLVKYQRDQDQLSTMSFTDYVDEAKKFCPLEFRNPGHEPFDLGFFRDVYSIIQSDLTNANLILVVKSFIAENFNSLKRRLGNGAEQTLIENRGMRLQVNYRQKSELCDFIIPYIHVKCCIHNCNFEVNGSNILGHIAQCHLDWFGCDDSAQEWQTIFNDSEVSFSINPNNYGLGEICFLGLLAYGGDRKKDPPVILEQCPKNTLLPASMHEIIDYCPIVLYACKLPVVIQNHKHKSFSKKEHANNEKLVIWAASFPLPFKIEFKISVQSKDYSNLRSQTMHVRYFHKNAQNPSDFDQYDNDFLALHYDELMALTNRFQKEFDLVISIQELKYPSINQ